MSLKTRASPRYDLLFSKGTFNGTLLIGPDPLGKTFDYGVFMEARRRLRLTGIRMTDNKRGIEEYAREFNFHGAKVKARIRLVHGRNYGNNLHELWRDALAHDGLIYLKTHTSYSILIAVKARCITGTFFAIMLAGAWT